MEFTDVLYKRRSVRAFKRKEVPDQQIIDLLKLAVRAPSSGNSQPWEFIVVKNQKTKKQLVKLSLDQDFIAEASHVVAVCTDLERSHRFYGNRGTELYTYQDTAAAIMVFLLAAADVGLATCWVGAFDEDAVADILKVPEKSRVVALIPVGYSKEPKYRRTGRRSVDRLTYFERYGNR